CLPKNQRREVLHRPGGGCFGNSISPGSGGRSVPACGTWVLSNHQEKTPERYVCRQGISPKRRVVQVIKNLKRTLFGVKGRTIVMLPSNMSADAPGAIVSMHVTS